MPIGRKTYLERMLKELKERWSRLEELTELRELHSASEGCKMTRRGRPFRQHPELFNATMGSAQEIRMAVADFQTILNEYKKLK